jgi:hypothetical protein
MAWTSTRLNEKIQELVNSPNTQSLAGFVSELEKILDDEYQIYTKFQQERNQSILSRNDFLSMDHGLNRATTEQVKTFIVTKIQYYKSGLLEKDGDPNYKESISQQLLTFNRIRYSWNSDNPQKFFPYIVQKINRKDKSIDTNFHDAIIAVNHLKIPDLIRDIEKIKVDTLKNLRQEEVELLQEFHKNYGDKDFGQRAGYLYYAISDEDQKKIQSAMKKKAEPIVNDIRSKIQKINDFDKMPVNTALQKIIEIKNDIETGWTFLDKEERLRFLQALNAKESKYSDIQYTNNKRTACLNFLESVKNIAHKDKPSKILSPKISFMGNSNLSEAGNTPIYNNGPHYIYHYEDAIDCLTNNINTPEDQNKLMIHKSIQLVLEQLRDFRKIDKPSNSEKMALEELADLLAKDFEKDFKSELPTKYIVAILVKNQSNILDTTWRSTFCRKMGEWCEKYLPKLPAFVANSRIKEWGAAWIQEYEKDAGEKILSLRRR